MGATLFTDRNKISSVQKGLFFAVSLYPFHFSGTLIVTPIQIGIFLSNIDLGGGEPTHDFALRVEIRESDTRS